MAVDEFSLETDFAAAIVADPEDGKPPAITPPEFGKMNSWRWMVQTGAAFDTAQSENTFALLGGGITYFMIDNVSLNLELNAMYFRQISEDALGLNFTLLFRWHFVAQYTWSIYIDIGVGLLGTTEKVPGPTTEAPRGGSSFNFTPQGGFGFTAQIAENVRFFGGARAYHISNAQIYEGNPGRDNFYVYAGVSFPF
jgi:hypothetical protein